MKVLLISCALYGRMAVIWVQRKDNAFYPLAVGKSHSWIVASMTSRRAARILGIGTRSAGLCPLAQLPLGHTQLQPRVLRVAGRTKIFHIPDFEMLGPVPSHVWGTSAAAAQGCPEHAAS
jgi:hypothetical protein